MTHPWLAAQWHPTRNGALLPDSITAGSPLRAWWVCEHGHEWCSMIASRSSTNGNCPTCSGRYDQPLTITHPQLAAEWSIALNTGVTPDQVTAGSSQWVWWTCPQGHDWLSSTRRRGDDANGCPNCDWEAATADAAGL